jgi:hypothetical protein
LSASSQRSTERIGGGTVRVGYTLRARVVGQALSTEGLAIQCTVLGKARVPVTNCVTVGVADALAGLGTLHTNIIYTVRNAQKSRAVSVQ